MALNLTCKGSALYVYVDTTSSEQVQSNVLTINCGGVMCGSEVSNINFNKICSFVFDLFRDYEVDSTYIPYGTGRLYT